MAGHIFMACFSGDEAAKAIGHPMTVSRPVIVTVVNVCKRDKPQNNPQVGICSQTKTDSKKSSGIATDNCGCYQPINRSSYQPINLIYMYII
jgi:hypothetical protein